MIIPARLSDLLEKDMALTGAVKLTLHDFQVWFEDRNLVFFPEYTDHGPDHITDVLFSAEGLIHDDSWQFLTPEDAAVLILSIVLHDCALHLSEEGFLDLINPNSNRPLLSQYSDQSWSIEWAKFLSEASRFDGRKLRMLFGDTEPIRTPPLDPRYMTYRDRLLIGEFLRRHHHRLGHEVSLWGVPGPGQEKIAVTRIPEGLANLAGLVARSHGQDLRASIELLPDLHRREHLKVHAPFLMVVVRIADYIQLHSARAPKEILKIRSLKSPISQGEWRAHDAVKDIHCTHDDPEAIVVLAEPENVKLYLKLKRLLSGLQAELDSSWAVLGEVYGRVQGLQHLSLTIRRVRSNLDDLSEFEKTVFYYPGQVNFESDPEILKLLIAPLYGNDPSIAIRELVQNAVDACRERERFYEPNSSIPLGENQSEETSVTVHLQYEVSDGSGWLIVKDNGIGMTPSTIKEYFLKAGASFRRSDAWKKRYEADSGKSRVLRSGRFGVGLLAAFLIGDRIEVETRHVLENPEAGIRFNASIDDEEIELKRATLPIGTTIKIKVTESTFKKLREEPSSWDWYRLENPSVERKITAPDWKGMISTTVLKKPKGHSMPDVNSDLPAGWHRIHHQDYKDIQWFYRMKGAPSIRIACNGIRLGSKYGIGVGSELFRNAQMRIPRLSVFDPDGKLPISLTRNSLTGPLPFEHELFEDVTRDLIAYLLASAPNTLPSLQNKSLRSYRKFISYPGVFNPDWYICTPNGLALATIQSLYRISPQNLFLSPGLLRHTFEIPREVSNIVFFNVDGLTYMDPWVRFALTGSSTQHYDHWLSNVKTVGRRVVISREYENRIKRNRVIPKSILPTIKTEWKDDDWLVMCTIDCPEPSTDFREIAKQAEPSVFSGLGEWYFDEKSLMPSTNESLLDRVFRETISTPVIPFKASKRKGDLATSFELLKDYLIGFQHPYSRM